MTSKITIQKSLEENRETIIKEMEEHLTYFMNQLQLKKKFSFRFPYHDVNKLFEILEEELELCCYDEFEKGNAYYTVSKYMYDKLVESVGHIEIVSRPRDSASIYQDSDGQNRFEMMIDKSIQSILDTDIYAPGYRYNKYYYIVPPSMVQEIKHNVENHYHFDSTNYDEVIENITQEEVHSEAVKYFEQAVNKPSKIPHDASEDWIAKRRKELIKELYELEQIESQPVTTTK